MEKIKISTIKGAEYNPRYLSDNNFETLKRSIEELGVIKPIIVREENGVIIAGHQRTKAMKALGIEECPAYILRGINKADEVRFNQMHNACELEINPNAPKVRINCAMPPQGGFIRVKNKDIEIVDIGHSHTKNHVLSKLLIKYGEFGCPICSPDGTIKISSAYAYSTKVTGHDMDVLCLPEDKMQKALYYLAQQYGMFSYENVERNTYHQRFAQLPRLRDGKKGKAMSNRSVLYRKIVIPYLEKQPKTTRILDFGAGQKDYYKMLLKEGWDILAVDPYHMKQGCRDIDIVGNANDFKRIAKDIEEKGLYDVVICDSVLNSIDSMEAETAVVSTVRALCRPGGHIFMSGRNYEQCIIRDNAKNNQQKDCWVHYFDENNFSGIYRNGKWFFQKFHTTKDIERIGALFSKQPNIYMISEGFYIHSVNENIISLEDAIKGLRFEWNLPLPNGFRYGLSDTIEHAYRKCRPED